MLTHLCIWCRGTLPYSWEGNLCVACLDRASGTEESGKPEIDITLVYKEEDCELVDMYIARIMSLGA